MRIFISSVQKEFAEERKALADYVAGDPLLSQFFDTFAFELDVPATDQRPDDVYLEEVRNCDLYLGIFGDDYGWENDAGLSPVHLEYNEATQHEKTRLIFVKGENDDAKHPKMQELISNVGGELVRRRFQEQADLLSAVYASLVSHLKATGNLTTAPWDARVPHNATLNDINPEKVSRFVKRARRERNFPLEVDDSMEKVLTHLDLLEDNKPKNAAILLFGKRPQSCNPTSDIMCAHFHGTEVAKPICSQQLYKGTAFELIDQAVNFVMSKINARVGTRENGPQVPIDYEIPREVVTEAIVNAVVHRDYNSSGSVQVMLFSDRLEVWNPGALPKELTLLDLRKPHPSKPGNPLLAEPLYLTKYIERAGTGTQDMIKRCQEVGLPEPDFFINSGFVVAIPRPTNEISDVGPKRPRPRQGRLSNLLKGVFGNP